VAELALLLGPEVLAQPENGQIQQVSPFYGGSDIHDGFTVSQRVVIVGRRLLQFNRGYNLPVQLHEQGTFIAFLHTVRRRWIQPEYPDSEAPASQPYPAELELCQCALHKPKTSPRRPRRGGK